jgi:hypothetical protein
MAYTNRGSNNRNNNNNYNKGDVKPRKSGAKFKIRDKNDTPCTTGWLVKNRVLTTFLCVVTGASKTGTSRSGKPWVTVMVKVTTELQKPFVVSGIMNSNNGNVQVKDLGIVILPTAKNGGFAGKLPPK